MTMPVQMTIDANFEEKTVSRFLHARHIVRTAALI